MSVRVSVAGGEAAAAKPLGLGLGGAGAPPAFMTRECEHSRALKMLCALHLVISVYIEAI